MENNRTQMQSLKPSWQNSEIKSLSMALTAVYKTQTTFKEPLELEDRLAGWKFVLEEDYSVEQILWALKRFMKLSPNMPVPADMVKILNPAPPRVTEAQYIQAQKWQERNGYPMFSDAKDIISTYEKQDIIDRGAHQEVSEEIRLLAGNSVKRLS